MYRIIYDAKKTISLDGKEFTTGYDKFFIQLSSVKSEARNGIETSAKYCTLAKFNGIYYQGFYGFDTKEEAQAHIETLNHTETFIPSERQSKLETEN